MIPLHLLVVDDDPDDARLVVHRIKRAGYAVAWQRVDNEADFRHQLAGAAPPFDLVICDFSMPRFTPVRALEILRERGLAIPLLLVSGNVSVDTAHHIMRLGAVGYLLKDQLETLGDVVREVLAA